MGAAGLSHRDDGTTKFPRYTAPDTVRITPLPWFDEAAPNAPVPLTLGRRRRVP
jgi:hypothetical protein